MNGYYVENISDLKALVKSMLKENDIVSVGGSRTLFEAGIIDILKSGSYQYLDRYQEGLSAAELQKLFRAVFFADVYVTSSNAVTEEGELYNVDGTGNRVAAMSFGPNKVIVIAGINKLVRDMDAAYQRNRQISAPANNNRLNKNTPCTIAGECKDCKSPGRICNMFVRTGFQSNKDRMHVIIVGESLGY
jgi:L-lactate utilization protein LutB